MCAINTGLFIIALVAIGIFGIVIGIFITNNRFKKGIREKQQKELQELESAQKSATKIISEAQKLAERNKRELLIETKEEIQKSRVELEKEAKERRVELQQQERRLIQKEETLDKKIDSIEQKEQLVSSKALEIDRGMQEVSRIKDEHIKELERMSNLTLSSLTHLMIANLQKLLFQKYISSAY